MSCLFRIAATPKQAVLHFQVEAESVSREHTGHASHKQFRDVQREILSV